MKNLTRVSALSLLLAAALAPAQTPLLTENGPLEWTWMGGSSAMSFFPNNENISEYGQPGVYGTLGTPAAGNIPDGRSQAVSWTDSSGNFWLFGGFGIDANGNQGSFNDLWKFSPSTNEWTWMGGSSVMTCTGSTCSQLGVYGTLGTPAAGNIPGGRSRAVSWTDSCGNIWLFGGTGIGYYTGGDGYLNELWKFNPSTNEWAWMGRGSTIGNNCTTIPNRPHAWCDLAGVYGTLGTPAAGNLPGGRTPAGSWIDSSGNFWLFGGFGNDINGIPYYLNDLWEFNPSTNEWAWMGGSDIYGAEGFYGTLGVPGAGNIPGCRAWSSSWTDSSGNFWLFGGLGLDSNDQGGWLNDLWEFNPSTNEWTWMGGSSMVPDYNTGDFGQPGVYGALGVFTAGNIPGGRDYAAS